MILRQFHRRCGNNLSNDEGAKGKASSKKLEMKSVRLMFALTFTSHKRKKKSKKHHEIDSAKKQTFQTPNQRSCLLNIDFRYCCIGITVILFIVLAITIVTPKVDQ